MSRATRSRKFLQLPISRGDYIVDMYEAESGQYDGELVVTTQSGRVFLVRRVVKYKRAFKVREITAHCPKD